MFDDYNKHDVAVYGGYIDDETKLLQSSSGGLATALSEFFLEQGGYVAGVAYSKDFYKAEYTIIHNISELGRLKGSKYVDCDKNNIYSDVKELINSGEKVLFFGLPCVVAALYSILGSRPENLLTCELICHGPTYPQVHYDYIKFLEKKYKSKIVDFSVRRKKDSWTPSYMYAEFENGEIFTKRFYQTEYGIAFGVLGKDACYDCKFKGNNRQGDIMLGDFWGATEKDIFWNKYGVSSIFAQTDRGNDFLKSTPNIRLFSTTFERIVENNKMVINSKKRNKDRDRFLKLLSKKGLIYAANHYTGFKGDVRKVISKVIPKKHKLLLKKVLKTMS
ncbi:MAG: Coenzyme F420 hydrogenase/dehydrogenase, beta subunit C-terminal domain [Clostridia bacterium]|nr:Coenzyme F420 hydrogenase/dehydrogenase, beta subunit C-terminal domain [Clostridia bacterium]